MRIERIGIFVIYSDGVFAVAYAGSQVVRQGGLGSVRAYCRAER